MLPTAENETTIKEEKERKTGRRVHLATQSTILFVSCTFLLKASNIVRHLIEEISVYI